MFFKIVSMDIVSASPIWSAQYFSMSNANNTSVLFPSVRIRDIVKERKETVNPQDDPFSEYTYLGLENIESNTRALFLPKIKTGAEIKSTAKVFRDGDVLYGKLRPNLNKVYLVDETTPIGICSTEILVLIPQENIMAEYLAEILLSDDVKQRAESLTRGASLPRVQADDFLDIEIPLPDKATQKEMVEFIRHHREKWFYYRSIVNNVPQHIQNSLYEKLYNDKPLSAYTID